MGGSRQTHDRSIEQRLDRLTELAVIIDLEDGATPAIRKKAERLARSIAHEVGSKPEIVLDQAIQSVKEHRQR